MLSVCKIRVGAGGFILFNKSGFDIATIDAPANGVACAGNVAFRTDRPLALVALRFAALQFTLDLDAFFGAGSPVQGRVQVSAAMHELCQCAHGKPLRHGGNFIWSVSQAST
jgi:hypothetical protein